MVKEPVDRRGCWSVSTQRPSHSTQSITMHAQTLDGPVMSRIPYEHRPIRQFYTSGGVLPRLHSIEKKSQMRSLWVTGKFKD
eukprot:5337153-Amphidinium_carterae.1